MKIKNLFLLAILALTISAEAQNNLPPECENMLFRGSIYHSFFEMTLVREGDKIIGSYFYIKSGRANALAVRGTIQPDGKFVLREFDRANRRTAEFQGTLSDDAAEYGLHLRGTWTNRRKKYLQFAADGEIVGFTDGLRIETRSIAEKNNLKRFELKAEYPEIVGVRAADLREFNLLAKKMATNPVAVFKKHMFRQTAEVFKRPLFKDGEFEISYQIKLANDRFISVQYFYSQISDGMIHPLEYVRNLNYDLKNKRQLKLADLFEPDAKYLEAISAYCLKELQNRPPVNDQKLAADDWASGAAAEAVNYENWNLTRRGLLITFEFYQIAPYPAGINYVLIPFDKLREIAKHDGALEQK